MHTPPPQTHKHTHAMCASSHTISFIWSPFKPLVTWTM